MGFSLLQSGIRCPTCKKIHGVKVGDMPKEYGSMHVRRTRLPLAGYEDYGCIEITYSFRPGTDRVSSAGHHAMLWLAVSCPC